MVTPQHAPAETPPDADPYRQLKVAVIGLVVMFAVTMPAALAVRRRDRADCLRMYAAARTQADTMRVDSLRLFRLSGTRSPRDVPSLPCADLRRLLAKK